MSVHLRKDGRWCVSYREGGRTRTKYFGKGLDAERRARDFNASLGLNEYVRRTPRDMSPLFADLANEYLQRRAARMAETTLDALLYRFAGTILPLLGHLRATDITPECLDRYIRDRLGQPIIVRLPGGGSHCLRRADGTPRTPTRTTIHTELTYVQAVLNWAVEAGYISHNPAARHRKPTRDDAMILPPSTAEIQRLMAESAPHLVRALSLSYYTGLRPGRAELLGMRWSEHYSPEAQVPMVVSAHKGGPPRRIVPVHDAFRRHLDAWRKEDAAAGIDYMIHYAGRPVRCIRGAFKGAKRRAGITRRLRLYDMRHAFVTALLAGNADLKATSQVVGHADVRTTLRIYQHVYAPMHRQAVSVLPALDIAPGTPGDRQKYVKKKAKKTKQK